MAGRYDIALNKTPKKSVRKQIVFHEDLVVAEVSESSELRTEMTRAPGNFTIACPNGFRVIIPIRYIDLREQNDINGWNGLAIGLPRSTILSIISDVNEALARLPRIG